MLLGAALIAYGVVRPLSWFRPSDVDGWYFAGAYLVTFCFVLGKPSVTAFPGWSASDITAAQHRLTVLADMTERDLIDVRFFIGLGEAASRRRIVALWWVVGSVWALSAWLAQKGFDKSDGNILASAIVPLVFCMFCAGLIAAYTRGVSQVYGLSYSVLMAHEAELSRASQAKTGRLSRVRASRRRQDRINHRFGMRTAPP